MTYLVEITPQAEEELSGIVGYIAQRAPQAAKRFADNIRIAIAALEELPQRCSVARESLGHQNEIRELLFKIVGIPWATMLVGYVLFCVSVGRVSWLYSRALRQQSAA
jgi:plasmid stabilization system protein ParE